MEKSRSEWWEQTSSLTFELAYRPTLRASQGLPSQYLRTTTDRHATGFKRTPGTALAVLAGSTVVEPAPAHLSA